MPPLRGLSLSCELTQLSCHRKLLLKHVHYGPVRGRRRCRGAVPAGLARNGALIGSRRSAMSGHQYRLPSIMKSDSVIQLAVERGERYGLESLAGVQRLVFAISEAEVYCDKDGIEGLIHRYGLPAMRTFAEAFEAVGATDIANALLSLAGGGSIFEGSLALANRLIADRHGYTYESLQALVRRSA